MRPKLDKVITKSNITEDYSSGDLVITEGTATTFWANVQELKSPANASTPSGFSQSGMRLRDHKMIKITARKRDVETIDIGDEVTIEDYTGRWTITDYYDLVHDRYIELVAEYRS